MIRIFFVFVCCALSSSAIAQQPILTGNGLQNWCTGGNPPASKCYNVEDDDPYDEGHNVQNCLDAVDEDRSRVKALCKGYLQAAHDVGSAQGTVCTTPTVKLSDMADVYVLLAPSIFEREPTVKEDDAVSVAIRILSRAFPCD